MSALGIETIDPEEREIKYLLDFAPRQNARILEIGSGDGRLTNRYRTFPKSIYALDVNLEQLRQSMNTSSSTSTVPVSFCLAKAEKLPFPDHFFDGVIFAWSY